ncbi:hypothetical protein NGB36_05650 [Streptomyces sp. RB6PN25]|uniref:FtsK domain-containing protein n=1 Tax=Streptomyces humicola TaxID=2953240 RepID=A0ABT1PQZ4_9ACTN|nr:hypothetical protein [Streptomyces humicola]MCQ4080088.1 hypothetical protein [Streptomyces humicola]
MARRSLTGILSGRLSMARGRDLAQAAAEGAGDVFHPVITLTRGLRCQAAWLRAWWARTPSDRRGPVLFLAASAMLVVTLLPYGPALVVLAVMGSAAWAGRDRNPVETGPDDTETAKLQAVYQALVPYLSDPADPKPLYAHDGSWEDAVTHYEFDDGRLVLLQVRYPAYFMDGDVEARARVERLLHAKAGRGREYRFDWNEEENLVTLTALPALTTGITAQRFVTAPGETILGFTDDDAVRLTIPVAEGEETWDAPPVVWRTGPRSTEPHLLAVGRPGTGITTLLRSIALQALHQGDVLVLDGAGTGEYAFLTGRPGVLAVESGLAGTLAALEWAARETERRLIAVNRARQTGRQTPQDARTPMWIVVDRPTALAHLAAAEGRPDPQELLEVPLRHGRAANVTVAVGDQIEALESLALVVRAHTRARVVLGQVSPAQVHAVLGLPPHTTPAAHIPAGRGYARLGDGPVHRLQVPHTPDPHDEETGQAHAQAVLSLLPAHPTPEPGTSTAGP